MMMLHRCRIQGEILCDFAVHVVGRCNTAATHIFQCAILSVFIDLHHHKQFNSVQFMSANSNQFNVERAMRICIAATKFIFIFMRFSRFIRALTSFQLEIDASKSIDKLHLTTTNFPTKNCLSSVHLLGVEVIWRKVEIKRKICPQ